MDMGNLMTWQFADLAGRSDELRHIGLVAAMRRGGSILFEEFGLDILGVSTRWTSDTARGWAAMAVGHAPDVSLEERIYLIRPFADDPHFAVREWSWLSLRPSIVEDPRTAIEVLAEWTSESSPNLRRFATEATRPRGVWSKHIPLFKTDPSCALPVLEPLKADTSLYVQDSVANWLNDASKSQPSWVLQLCASWLAEVPDSRTERVCRRATRTIRSTARA